MVNWKDWCWSWNSSTLATSCEELSHWKRHWCWEGLGAGGEGDDRGWDGWMASPTRWAWVWVDSGSWWWTGRPGVLRFMESQRVRHDWATELNILSNSDNDLLMLSYCFFGCFVVPLFLSWCLPFWIDVFFHSWYASIPFALPLKTMFLLCDHHEA